MASPPRAGDTLTVPTGSGGTLSPAGYAMNLAVTLVPSNLEDVSVQIPATPAPMTVGVPAVLTANVTNSGPGLQPITFVDTVATGLQLQSAVAGDGTCVTSGQTATCTILGLAPGQAVPVDVVVTPSTAGGYSNLDTVSLPAGITDPNVTNNAASAPLTVAAAPAPPAPTQVCVVPKLPKIPVSAARTLLTELGCTVATTTRHSATAQGVVIGLAGATGTFPYQQKVTLVVSSGPKHKKHKKHRKHKKH